MTKSSQKVAIYFSCIDCNYTTSKQTNYDKHLLTAKHQRMTNDDKKVAKSSHHTFDCICGNIYKYRQGLFNHKKKCLLQDTINDGTVTMPIPPEESKDNYIDIINRLIADNRELRNTVINQSVEHKKETKEIVSKMMELSTINNVTNNTINSVTNNKLNINVFLNEKCKDAMNFTDFIETVQITDDDLENNASLGFVGGMSKIFLDNLKNISIYKRPIHCTDIKGETIYIKDEDRWEKEEDMRKFKNAIQEISRKSMVHLSQWREENPEYVNLDSELGEKYILMNQSSIAGNNRDVYHNKIIKTVAKEVTLDKTTHAHS